MNIKANETPMKGMKGIMNEIYITFRLLSGLTFHCFSMRVWPAGEASAMALSTVFPDILASHWPAGEAVLLFLRVSWRHIFDGE